MSKRKHYLFQNVGFIQTLEILGANKGFMLLEEFYRELKKESYYNAFYRVRDKMIKLGIIEVSKGKIKTIETTIDGFVIKNLIKNLIEMTQ